MKILLTLLIAASAFILNSCDTANAEEWKAKYEKEKIAKEQERIAKELALAEGDSLETVVGILQMNIDTLYNVSKNKIDSLKFVISTFPDTNMVIARYKVIRDAQVIEMLHSINGAVINYTDSLRVR